MEFAFTLIVYFYLSYKEPVTPYKQATLFALTYWGGNFIVGSMLHIFLGTPLVPLVFLIPFMLHVIALLAGTSLGLKIRNKNTLDVNAV